MLPAHGPAPRPLDPPPSPPMEGPALLSRMEPGVGYLFLPLGLQPESRKSLTRVASAL